MHYRLVLTVLWLLTMLGIGSFIGSVLSGPIIGLIVPIVAGAVAKPLAAGIQVLVGLEAKLPNWAQVIISGIVGVLLGAAGSIIPGLPTTLGGFNATTIEAAIAGILGVIAHHVATINTTTVVTAHNQTAIADLKPGAALAQTLATKDVVAVSVPTPGANGIIDSGAGALLGKR